METQPVAHPSDYILDAFDAGNLDDTGGQAVRAHLEVCPACRTRQRLRAGRHGAAAAADAVSLGDTRGGIAVPQANEAAGSGPTALLNVPPELADHPDYELLGELGHGGMGVVYLAKHRLSGRREVLKVMSKALIGQADSRERFLREIQSAARLDHKNVVKMYTAQERGELMVLVMEYVPGEDLAQVVKSRGALPVLNACYYVQQAASGLQHAFEKGMIHRDIKPQNLILARQGRKHTVKVLDFGLAKASRGEDMDTGLTGTGVLMGTPGYVAPEQILNAAAADIRADIYSLGCTLYHLLAGNPPFSGKSLFEILQAHHSVEAQPLNLVRAEVPAALTLVVGKMMAKNAAQRYQTPMEVVRALEPFVKGVLKPLSPQPAPPQGEQPDAEPPVIQATRIEGPATIARGERKPVGSKGEQRDAWSPPVCDTVMEDDGIIGRALKTADAKKSKTWLMAPLIVVLLLALVLIVWGAKRMMHSTETSADDPGRVANEYNCRFAWPGKPWTRQTNLQQNLHVHIGMASPQHHSSFALFFKDYKTRTPSDAEMLYEALSRLRSYFNGLEWEEKKTGDEPARLAGRPAKVFEFQGDDAEETPMKGECHMMTMRGYGYWFFTWAPFDELRKDGEPIRAEWTRMRQRLTLLDGRKGWMAKPPETQTVQGTKAKYQLSHLKSLWTRETAEGYDPSADLVLKGHYPEDSDGKPLASNDATFQVLVLPKQANLKAAAAAAREYLKKQEEELYPGIKMEPIKDKGGEVDWVGDIGQERGQRSKLNVMKTEELEHFLLLAVVNRPEGVIVLVGDCLWERRDYWDQEFAALLSTFKIQDR